MAKAVINKDDFSQALKVFKQGEYDADMLILKFDELRSSMENISEESLSELKALITEAKLPDELSKQLFNSLSVPKTRIFVPPPEGESPEDHSRSHLSSLLDELLKWDKGDEQNEIKAGQTVRDTYRLVSKIGKGGMGEVWKAIDLILDAGNSRDKYVAIKFINHQIRSHPYALKALVREFARYKKLIHPNIVRAYELNRDEREVFIALEYLDGISLKEFIKQHPGGISLNEAKPIIEGICKALKYSHEEGIIHLDLKPSNVFYDPKNKTSKVIDFGIARLSKQSDRDKTRFDPGSLGAVSTAYASVEMLLLEDKPDPRDDIYGLACIVYELISGKHVFNGAIATKAERDKMHPKPIKRLKKAEFQAILKGLSFDRNDRTPTVEQFFQELYLPQITVKRKLHRFLIIIPIFLLAMFLIPLLVNKGYDVWQKNQIIDSISQKRITGIEKFQTLSIDEQLNLLLDENVLLSIVKFSIYQSSTGTDAIEFLNGFKPEVQDILFKKQDVRELLLNHYIENINQALSANDFNQAMALSSRIIEKYPDSKSLADEMIKVLDWKNNRLSELETKYYQCLADKSQSLLELKPCLQASLKDIEVIAPQHNILVEPKLSVRYMREVSTALKNKAFSPADKLLNDWRAMVRNDTPQRDKLEHTLKYQQQVFNISKRVADSSSDQIQVLITDLLKLDSSIRTDVLSQPAVRQKLMDYFNRKVSADIEAKNYIAAVKQVETAFGLFTDIKDQQQPLQQLISEIHEHKNNTLEELAQNYKTILASEKVDVKALQNLQRQIATIEPNDPLVKYPGVSEMFVKQIDKEIEKKQFDLALTSLENWKIIKPADSKSKEFLILSKKYKQQLSSYKKRLEIEKRIYKALQNNQLTDVTKAIKDLQSNFSVSQKQRVINNLQTPLIIFYQQQIQSAIKKDEYVRANVITDEALTVIPEEKSLVDSKNQIEKEKANRIHALVEAYQTALNSKTATGEQIFSYLITLRKIDSQYLEKNPQLYQMLKNQLLRLAKHEQNLSKMQNITTQWDKFFNGREKSIEAKNTYRETRNLIALRYLYIGRKLKQEGKQNSANEFLIFGLSLDPISTVQKALEKELQNEDIPATSEE